MRDAILESTSMAIKPGTNELYIVTNDGAGGTRRVNLSRQCLRKRLATVFHQSK
jgi:hypothetical protein